MTSSSRQSTQEAEKAARDRSTEGRGFVPLSQFFVLYFHTKEQMKRQRIESNEEEAPISTVVSPLVEVVCFIQDNFSDTIKGIDMDYDNICQGVDETDGSAVVDRLEAFIPLFYQFTDKAALLKEAFEKVEAVPNKLKASPSATELRKIIGDFLTFEEPYYGDQTYKSAMSDAMNADDGAVVNDFLQGDPLTKMKEVADACRAFLILEKHLDEIGRFSNGEFNE